MTRPTPLSTRTATLFPYTQPFRSDVADHDRDEVERREHPHEDRHPVEAGVGAARGREVAAEVPPHRREVEDLPALPDQLVAPARTGQRGQRQDRKITRLNSSH